MDKAVKLAIELTLMVALMAGWTLLSLLRTEENLAGSSEPPASTDGGVEAMDSCSEYSVTPTETDGWSGSLVSPAATNDLHSSPEPPAGTEAGPVPARPLVEVELAGTVQTICSVQAATAKKKKKKVRCWLSKLTGASSREWRWLGWLACTLSRDRELRRPAELPGETGCADTSRGAESAEFGSSASGEAVGEVSVFLKTISLATETV